MFHFETIHTLNINDNHIQDIIGHARGHSRLGYYFWDKGLKDYVALDLGVYHDLINKF